ncbi:DNA-binding protein WhiA [Eubacteriaceae bacterium ES3]|nr:DNA-binding protein WhiA [Eubacteriaceae bacterium ES3]
MTFSAILKKDLSRLPLEHEAQTLAELAGIISAVGTVKIISLDDNPSTALSVKTENPAVATRTYQLLKKLYAYKASVEIQKTRKFRDHRNYLVTVADSQLARKIFNDTQSFAGDLSRRLNDNGAKAYLRGVFLGCGSVTNPEKTYHLELVSKTGEDFLQNIKTLLSGFEIRSNLIRRKNSSVLYIKESESVANFLNVIGAHRGLLEMENIRIVKEMRNDVNRQVNCETANLNKTVAAACDQIADIMVLKDHYGFKNLPKNLYAIAEVRLNYPDATIKELGQRLDPPVGKSGVYHRLKKLSELAQTVRNEKGLGE